MPLIAQVATPVFREFAREEGIRQKSVYGIVQDPWGFLWTASQDGVHRFDGYENHAFQPPFPFDSFITRLAMQGSTLWLLDRGGGLARLDTGSHAIELVALEELTTVEDLVGAADGVWICGEHQVVKLSEEGRVLGRFKAPGPVVRLFADDGQTWAVVKDRGLFRVPDDGDVLVEVADIGGTSTAITVSSDTLWLGTDDGIYRLSSGEKTAEKLASIEGINCLLTYEDGLLIGSNKGLFLFDVHQGVLPVPILHQKGSSSVRCLFRDQAGNIWQGTDRGLYFANASAARFRNYLQGFQGNGLADARVFAIAEDKVGFIWVGTPSGLGALDPYVGRFRSSQWQDPVMVTSLLPLESQYLLVGTARGLYSVAPKGSTVQPLSGADDLFTTALLAGSQTIWWGTTEGLMRLDAHLDTSSVRAEAVDDLVGITIRCMLLDGNQTLWLGTDRGLAFRPETDLVPPTWIRDPADLDLTRLRILSLLETKKGQLWAGTHGRGLLRIEGNEVVQKISSEDGLSDNTIYAILEDKRGMLWLSTNQGIVRFHSETGELFSLNVFNGLCENEFNLGAGLETRSGQFYFGSQSGLSSFYPVNITPDATPMPIQLSSLRVLGASVPFSIEKNEPLGGTIDLPAKAQPLMFTIAGLHFAPSENQRYAYKLDDSSWRMLDPGDRIGVISGLSPGLHRLRLRATNADGIWIDRSEPVLFHLGGSRFSLLHLLLIPALVGVLFLGFTWGRGRRKEPIPAHDSATPGDFDTIKRQFLANLSHELRTPLNGIVGLSESLLERVREGESARLNQDISLVVACGKRMAMLVDQLLSFSSLDSVGRDIQFAKVDLYSMCEQLLTLLRANHSKKVTLYNDVPPGFPHVRCDEAKTRQVLGCLVDNAIKFSQAGEVRIIAFAEEGRPVVEVRDTGIGIGEAELDRIFEEFRQVERSSQRVHGGIGIGLPLARKLVVNQGGQMWVKSEPGVGSSFFFSLSFAAEVMSRSLRTGTFTRGFESTGTARILVIDDDGLHRQAIANHLEDKGYLVRTTSKSDKALAMLEEEHCFDLVLLATRLSGVSGFDVGRRIRTLYTKQELPIIYIAIGEYRENLRLVFEAGGNDLLNKPAGKSELWHRVENQLEMLATIQGLEQRLRDRNLELELKARELTKQDNDESTYPPIS